MPDEAVELDFKVFLRKPFVVEAVLVTEDNIRTIADMIGKIQFKRDTGEPYILVNDEIIPSIPYVYLGFHLTKMVIQTDDGEQINYRGYSTKAFDRQFVELDENGQQWLDYLSEASSDNNSLKPQNDSDDAVVETGELTTETNEDDEDKDQSLVTNS